MNKRLKRSLEKMIGEEVEKVFDREADVPSYLSQDDYPTCLARAEAGFADIVERPTKFVALLTAKHRSIGKHKEDRSLEIATLEADKAITAADVKMANSVVALGFWNH